MSAREGAQVLLEMTDEDGRQWPALILSSFGSGLAITIVQPLGALFHGSVLKCCGYASRWLQEGFKVEQVLAKVFGWTDKYSPEIAITTSNPNVSANVFEDEIRWLVAVVNYSYLDDAVINITVPNELLTRRKGQATRGKGLKTDSTRPDQLKSIRLKPSGVGFVTFQKQV